MSTFQSYSEEILRVIDQVDLIYPDFVKNFSFEYGQTYFSHWMFPVCSLTAYLIVIYSFQFFMNSKYPASQSEGRPKGFELRTFTFVHNAFLCILSVFMATGNLIESIRLFLRSGGSLQAIFCDPEGTTTHGAINFWTYVFYLSKFYELIDTVLMVAKRRPLTFLHVYHHIITLALVYVALCDKMALQWVAVITNGYIHVLMYYYYAQSARGVTVSWKKYLTLLQITQFVLDLVIPQTYLYYLYGAQVTCSGSETVLWFGEGVILSFLILFIQFYSSTYKSEKKKNQ